MTDPSSEGRQCHCAGKEAEVLWKRHDELIAETGIWSGKEYSYHRGVDHVDGIVEPILVSKYDSRDCPKKQE